MLIKELPQPDVLGPMIRKKGGDIYAPYQEAKERLGEQRYDVTVVFGEGPFKNILFRSELSGEEVGKYEAFIESPRTQPELPFYVIDDTPHGLDAQSGLDKNPYYEMMHEIRSNPNLSEEEKHLKIEARRLEWQRMGRFGMRRWGEFNALATGLALYLDMSETFILTGGRTMSKDQEASLKEQFAAENPEREDDQEAWKAFVKEHVPSEAELMRDIILRRVGKLMFYRDNPREKLQSEFAVTHPIEDLDRQFGETFSTEALREDYERHLKVKQEQEAIAPDERTIDEFPLSSFDEYVSGRMSAFRFRQYREFEKDRYEQYVATHLLSRLIIEDEALTTPENVVYSVNKNPELFAHGNKVAVITNDHHVPRASEFIHLFGGVTGEIGQISAQRILHEEALIRDKEVAQAFWWYFFAADEGVNPDLENKQRVDREKTAYLKMPERIMYWIGHLGMLNDAHRVQTLLDETRERDEGDHRWIEALSLAFNEAGLLYSDREEDKEKADNFYYLNIAELEHSDPELFRRFKEGMTSLISAAKRDIIFVNVNGHLEKTAA